MTATRSDPKSNLRSLRTERETYIDHVVTSLESAIRTAREEGMTSCSIVMSNESRIHTNFCHYDRFQLMGALAHAQYDIFNPKD